MQQRASRCGFHLYTFNCVIQNGLTLHIQIIDVDLILLKFWVSLELLVDQFNL